MSASSLPSGLIELTADAVERLPESPGLFRLRTSGQRVLYVGWAGADGLRRAVQAFHGSRSVAGAATVEYSAADSAEAARLLAESDIRALRPSYNDGFERYRHTETPIPTSGRRTRRAMHNP